MPKGGWFMTFTGVKMFPFDPDPEMINIDDIAHALSNTCRFSGHSQSFYSVAQHSTLVSVYASPENQMWGLLHDAAEAYLGDVITPVKHSMIMDQYRLCEENMMKAIAVRFGLSWPQPPEIGFIDKQFLCSEARDLGLMSIEPEWTELVNEYGYASKSEIVPVDPIRAEAAYKDWYEVLTSRR